jgi:fructokinase
MTYRIGFDLGGTKIKVVVLDDAGRTIFDQITLTPLGPAAIYDNIAVLYQLACEKIDFAPHTVGIGIPGNAARPSYLLDGTDIHQELWARLGREVKVENDANCFALAEAVLGAGRNAHSVFGVILGTGVGGGIVIEGRLYRGHSGLAGEWGHTPLYTGGVSCWCGSQGCVEQYISGRAIEKKYRANTGRVGETALSIFSTKDVVNFAIVHEFYADLAQGLANIINYYDPEVIVLGGSVSKVKEIYEVVPAKVEKLIFNTQLRTRIVENELGGDAGAVGAALL